MVWPHNATHHYHKDRYRSPYDVLHLDIIDAPLISKNPSLQDTPQLCFKAKDAQLSFEKKTLGARQRKPYRAVL
jgi:hypothetical protein